MEEIWKDIPGYEGIYQVSDQGQVKALARKVATSSKWGYYFDKKEHMIKPGMNHNGYLHASLSKHKKPKLFKVHKLVLLAFVGPSDLIIDHLNGIKNDNRLCNLEYVTHRQNSQRYHSKKKNGLPLGVHKHKDKFMACVVKNRKQHYLGIFNTPEEAHQIYCNAVSDLDNLHLYKKTTIVSVYGRGVQKDDGKYTALIRYKGEHIYLGRFDTAEEARNAYQNALKMKKNNIRPQQIINSNTRIGIRQSINENNHLY